MITHIQLWIVFLSAFKLLCVVSWIHQVKSYLKFFQHNQLTFFIKFTRIKGDISSNICKSFVLIEGLDYVLLLHKGLSLMFDGVCNAFFLIKLLWFLISSMTSNTDLMDVKTAKSRKLRVMHSSLISVSVISLISVSVIS